MKSIAKIRPKIEFKKIKIKVLETDLNNTIRHLDQLLMGEKRGEYFINAVEHCKRHILEAARDLRAAKRFGI